MAQSKTVSFIRNQLQNAFGTRASSWAHRSMQHWRGRSNGGTLILVRLNAYYIVRSPLLPHNDARDQFDLEDGNSPIGSRLTLSVGGASLQS